MWEFCLFGFIVIIFFLWLFLGGTPPPPVPPPVPPPPPVDESQPPVVELEPPVVEIEPPVVEPEPPVVELEPPKLKYITEGEQITCQAASEVFGVPFTSVRPPFLRNPETGRNMELDCYNAELNIAVEYNGPQHYEFPNRYHHGEVGLEKFLQQVRRDKWKRERCDQLGIYLIPVPYTIPYDRIKDWIECHRPEQIEACRRRLTESP